MGEQDPRAVRDIRADSAYNHNVEGLTKIIQMG